MENLKKVTLYKITSYLIAVAILLHILIGSFLEENKNTITAIVLGNPYIEFIGKTLNIKTSTRLSSIKFHFSNNHDSEFIKKYNSNDAYDLNIDQNGKFFELSYSGVSNNINSKNIKINSDGKFNINTTLSINLINDGTKVPINRIDKIEIDGVVESLVDISSGDGKIKFENLISLQYPYSIKNIGYFIANNIGELVPYAIIIVLLPLAIVQLLLTIIYLFLDPVKKIFNLNKGKNYLDTVDESLVDLLTSSISIPLGLFGTIASLWTAFEIMSFEIGNLHQVLDLLTKALFTTFLGFLAYVSLVVRRAINKAINISNANIENV